MSQKIRTISGRVVLYKLENNEWLTCSSGYLSPNPIETGKKVWVGSITSRDGYRTTEVVSMCNTIDIKEAVQFETKSGSTYLVISKDHDSAAKLRNVSDRHSSNQ